MEVDDTNIVLAYVCNTPRVGDRLKPTVRSTYRALLEPTTLQTVCKVALQGILILSAFHVFSCSPETGPTGSGREVARPLSPHLPPGCEDPETDPDCWLRYFTNQDWEAIWNMRHYIDTGGPQICIEARDHWVSAYYMRPPYRVIEEPVVDAYRGEVILGEYHNWSRIEMYEPWSMSPAQRARIAVHEFLHGRWWDDGTCMSCTHEDIYAQAAQCVPI